MVKAILVPKFEDQTVRRISYDTVCTSMLPQNKDIVCIAICQDGRPSGESIEWDVFYWQKLYTSYKCLNQPGVTVRCSEFSFFVRGEQEFADMVKLLDGADIFYMTGFGIGYSMSPKLVDVFRESHLQSKDECHCSSWSLYLFRKLRAMVLYNQIVYTGTCGGALCAGLRYRSVLNSSTPTGPRHEYDLFNFFCGVSVLYNAGKVVEDCKIELIDVDTFQITGGAALAIHLTSDVVLASSFQSGKNNKWWQWCQAATIKHQEAVLAIRNRRSGPWYYPSIGVWVLCADGSVIRLNSYKPNFVD